MKYVIFALILFSLTACRSAGIDESGTVPVAYLRDDGTLQYVHLALSDDKDTVAYTLEQLFVQPGNTRLRTLLPSGISVLEYTLENGSLTLHFSDGYAEVSPINRSVAEAGITQTMTALDGIDTVTFLCDALPGYHRHFSSDDFLFNDPVIKPLEREITLYFVMGQDLISGHRVVVVRENEHLARYIIESLLSGIQGPDLRTPIPARTQLVSLAIDSGICYLNLSGEFINDMPNDAEEQRLALAVIVYSLTELDDIEGVRFIVEDSFIEHYGAQSTESALTRADIALPHP
jgi:germination protein M